MVTQERNSPAQKFRALIGTIFVVTGSLERIAGWLAGATVGDFSKAFQNVHDWLADTPIVGDGRAQAAVFGLGIILVVINLWTAFRTPKKPAPSDLEQDNPHRAKCWMDCRPCEGSGQVVIEYNSLFFHARRRQCFRCNGHGGYTTDLWSRPDCRSCGGSGWVQQYSGDFRTFYAECTVCGGHGKRPYGA